MNSAKCQTTGHSASFLNFAREMRSPGEVASDLRSISETDNFVPEVIPYLLRIGSTLTEARSINEKCQDRQKKYADMRRKVSPDFDVGDKVLVTLHTKSSQEKQTTAKFDPKRDGPYLIIQKVSPTSFQIANVNRPEQPLGTYHRSALIKYQGEKDAFPVAPIRKRGRPKKTDNVVPGSSTLSRPRNQRGRM